MNFNLLFSTLAGLSFVLKFSVNQKERQDFFLFNGSNSSAHLFREGNMFYFHLFNKVNFSVYRLNSTADLVTFSWNDFFLNDERMELISNLGNISELNLDSFTFTSPIVEFSSSECENNLEPLYQLKNVNYGYIATMIFTALVLTESKSVGIKVFDHFKTRTIYETMNAIRRKSHPDVEFRTIKTEDV